MTESARISLFAEVDHAADTLREDNPSLRAALWDELRLLFRKIQLRRMPQLSAVEWLELFETWLTEYVTRCERVREEAIAGIIATIDELRAQTCRGRSSNAHAAKNSTTPAIPP